MLLHLLRQLPHAHMHPPNHPACSSSPPHCAAVHCWLGRCSSSSQASIPALLASGGGLLGLLADVFVEVQETAVLESAAQVVTNLARTADADGRRQIAQERVVQVRVAAIPSIVVLCLSLCLSFTPRHAACPRRC